MARRRAKIEPEHGAPDEPEETGEPTSGNGMDPEMVREFVARIESLQSEIDTINADAAEAAQPHREAIAEIKLEAHDAGLGRKEFAAVLRRRRLQAKASHAGDSLDLAQRAAFEEMIASLDRLAAEIGPLGQAAADAARAAHG